MRRVYRVEREEMREKKQQKTKPVTITKQQQHCSIINKANKRQMKMEKLSGKVFVYVSL